MDLGLKGKAVLLTGGTGGLGSAIAEEFAAEGARLALVARGRERLQQVAVDLHNRYQVEVLPVVADLTKSADATRMVKDVLTAFGRIDVLVNAAGSPARGKFDQRSDEAFTQELNLKMYGYVRVCREVFPLMMAQHSGRIINITGSHGIEPGYFNPSSMGWVSGMECAALMNLTKSLALDGGPNNVLVNAVSPGWFWTQITRNGIARLAQETGRKPEEVIALREKQFLLGRGGEPKEAAAIVVFLASSRASYITGAVVPVDGGNSHSY